MQCHAQKPPAPEGFQEGKKRRSLRKAVTVAHARRSGTKPRGTLKVSATHGTIVIYRPPRKYGPFDSSVPTRELGCVDSERGNGNVLIPKCAWKEAKCNAGLAHRLVVAPRGCVLIGRTQDGFRLQDDISEHGICPGPPSRTCPPITVRLIGAAR